MTLRQDSDLGEAAEEFGAWPDQIEHEQGNAADHEAGGEGRAGAQFGILILARRLCEQALGDLAKHFTNRGVSGLHHHGVQGPEAALHQTEERTPTEIADGEDGGENEQRPNPNCRCHDRARQRANPVRGDDRSKTEQETRDDQQERPRHDELGQADLDEEAAGKREHGMLLGARRVGLDVAVAGIDDGLPRRSSIGVARHLESRGFGVPDRSVAIHFVEG